MERRLLIVEDDVDARIELAEYFRFNGFSVTEAGTVESALSPLRAGREIDVAIVDIHLPGRGGLAFLRDVRNEIGDGVEFIVLSGSAEKDDVVRAFRNGAHDFFDKPTELHELRRSVEAACRKAFARRAASHRRDWQEAEIAAKSMEIVNLSSDLENAYEEALEIIATASEFKDTDTGNHIRRIGAYCTALARTIGWPEERQRMVALAAPLHDVGKIGTPEAVLLKPGKLEPAEVTTMKQHSTIGHRILSRSRHPVMQCAARIALGHHERWDGSGYPHRLSGTEIPIEARLAALADIYDALRSKRPYKPGLSHAETLSIMIEGDGRTAPQHFDPYLLEAFESVAGKFQAIFDQFCDE
jgi:putative two-component system response regulator